MVINHLRVLLLRFGQGDRSVHSTSVVRYVELREQITYLVIMRGRLDEPGLSIPRAGGFDSRAARQINGQSDDVNSKQDRQLLTAI